MWHVFGVKCDQFDAHPQLGLHQFSADYFNPAAAQPPNQMSPITSSLLLIHTHPYSFETKTIYGLLPDTMSLSL